MLVLDDECGRQLLDFLHRLRSRAGRGRAVTVLGRTGPESRVVAALNAGGDEVPPPAVSQTFACCSAPCRTADFFLPGLLTVAISSSGLRLAAAGFSGEIGALVDLIKVLRRFELFR
jgi:hypothetical protein